MNTEQLKLLLPILRQFSEHLSNDWELPNTPEGKALWVAINEWLDPNDTGEWTMEEMDMPTLFMPDSTALDYLIHCIENGLIRSM